MGTAALICKGIRMNKFRYSLAVLCLLTSSAVAQQVPELGAVNAPALPAVQMITPSKVVLDPKEAHAVALAAEWMANPDKPRMGDDGTVRYLYGATLPTLVCSPMQICAIRLQPGEVVNQIDAADKVRWKFTPSIVGSGMNQVTEVVVKVKDAGLEQSIRIATDRRGYTIRLRSTSETWMPVLSFDYPDAMDSAWEAYAANRERKVQATTLPTGQSFDDLDFGFRLSGDTPGWTPLRVYTDGQKTFIQFPPGMDEAPALVALDGNEEQIVNYRVDGDRFVVDKVVTRAALISGVGRQQARVNITRDARH